MRNRFIFLDNIKYITQEKEKKAKPLILKIITYWKIHHHYSLLTNLQCLICLLMIVEQLGSGC